MITVIGTENCPKCKMTQMILDNKGAKYEYKLLNSFTQEEQNIYLDKAKESGMLSFPLIVKDDKLVTLQEV